MSQGRDPKRVVRLLEIFERAAELSGEEREAFLAEACEKDTTLRVEVEVLLAERDGDRGEFLEPPELVEGSGAVAPEFEPDEDGRFRLGDFDVIRELGRGGAGVVYLAEQRSLERLVALKVLSTNLTTTPEQIERFHRESRSVAKLDHAGIVKVHTDGVEGANHWFAMEYIQGRDLETELGRQRTESPLPEEAAVLPRPDESQHAARVARFVADAARALAAAHAAGVVHRDVKPSNLLLDDEGGVHLVDFGLARDSAHGTITRSKQVAGTVHNMSPEQARVEEVKVDHRTDVYSLGVVLYEMLTLRRPFTGKTDLAVFERIKKGDPPPIRSFNASVPRDLETICGKAMALDVRERYQSAGDFADDLERFVNREPIAARRTPALERVRRGVVARRTALKGAAVGLGLGAAAVGGAWFFGDRGPRSSTRVRLVDGRRADYVLSRRVSDEGRVGGRFEEIEHGRIDRERLFVLDSVDHRLDLVDGEERSARVLLSYFGDEAERSLDVRLTRPADHTGEMRVCSVEGPVVGSYRSLEFERGRRDPQLKDALTFSVEVDPFLVDRACVTHGEFRAFLDATGRDPGQEFRDRLGSAWSAPSQESDELPVTFVDYEEAQAYAAWVGKRLPTAFEYLAFTFGSDAGWIESATDAEVAEWNLGVVSDLPEKQRNSIAGILRHARPADSGPDQGPAGLKHVIGNTDIWTSTPASAEALRGGEIVPSWQLRVTTDHPYSFSLDEVRTGRQKDPLALQPIDARFFTLGLRCVKSLPN